MDAARAITRLGGWAGGKFYTLERAGEPFPDGPVLVVANHPNALIDPIVVFRVAGRVVRPLAKATLFDHAVVGAFLRGLGGVPVYRRQDDPTLMQRNERMFDAAVAALRAGEAVQIYPEGQSHDEPRINPLKTGAARIAFQAESSADWLLGLRIVPIGLTFARKSMFRGRALAVVGAPFGIADRRAAYEADEYEAVRALTAEIAARLEALTLNLEAREDLDLVDAAERIWAREKGLADWREREALGQRLPRMRAFAQGLAWLRRTDPERHARLARRVRLYARQARLLGAGEADVPPEYGAGGVARWVGRQLVTLGLGLPLAAIGLVFWYPPYLLVRLVASRLPVEERDLGTYKLGLALFVMPLAWLGWTLAALFTLGPVAAVAAALLLPPLGLLVHGWTARWQVVREDARLFFRLLGRSRRQRRLAELRRVLVAEFDDIEALMARERGPEPGAVGVG